MSASRDDKEKDRVIFATEGDHNTSIDPAVQKILEIDLEEEGPLKENGDINWNCPCMGGMVSGPCGYEFRQSFSCFHNSTAEPKGSDCLEQFVAMRQCFDNFPDLYGKSRDDEDEEEKENWMEKEDTTSVGGRHAENPNPPSPPSEESAQKKSS